MLFNHKKQSSLNIFPVIYFIFRKIMWLIHRINYFKKEEGCDKILLFPKLRGISMNLKYKIQIIV